MTYPKHELFDGSVQEMWEMCRNHVAHENNLLNHRVGWFLAVQGFVFAVFVGLLATRATGTRTLSMIMVAATGFSAVWILHPFIASAVASHYRWGRIWRRYVRQLKSQRCVEGRVIDLYPDVVGLRHSDDVYHPRRTASCWKLGAKLWNLGAKLLPRTRKRHRLHPVFALLEAVAIVWAVLVVVMTCEGIVRYGDLVGEFASAGPNVAWLGVTFMGGALYGVHLSGRFAKDSKSE